MSEPIDIVIAGSGPVGLALALALHGSGHAVAIFAEPVVAPPTGALRPVALSYGSRLILERLGVWHAFTRASRIERIHVSQRGAFGRVELTAAESALPALGYVVEYGELTRALAAEAAARGCRLETGRVGALQLVRDGAAVSCDVAGRDEAVCASLAVVADGGGLDGIAATRTHGYDQVAVAARITTETPHRNTAYERFTPEGPIALLPFGDERALVWTVAAERAGALLSAPETAFADALQCAFGNRLGRILRVSSRAAHPLVLRYATAMLRARAALVGNAAQTLHPVAGQGFNLGLRDAWELADIVHRTSAADLGSAGMLDRYRARRRLDRSGGIAVTHGLVHLFSSRMPPLGLVRSAGLAVIGCLPPVKDFVVRRMTFGARG